MHIRRKFRLKLRSGTLLLGERTLVMGVLNITPDSFSDGGEFYAAESAIEQALHMERAGADLIDIGAESTHPGSHSISIEEELRRLLPVLGGLRRLLKIPISIDTQKSAVAEAALVSGAELINDISGLKNDPGIAEVAARHQVPLILMHLRGKPSNMQKGPFARDVLKDVVHGLHASIAKARKAGVEKSQLVVDPGIGFGKSFEQNYELLRKLSQLAALGHPILIGTSRKAFLGAILLREGQPAPPAERIWGTAATLTASILGGAHIVRVHDVSEMLQVARTADRILKSGPHRQNEGLR